PRHAHRRLRARCRPAHDPPRIRRARVAPDPARSYRRPQTGRAQRGPDGAQVTTRNDDPRQTRAMSEGERPLVRHAERFRLTVAGQSGEASAAGRGAAREAAPSGMPATIEGAGTILRVGSKDGNSLRLQNETVSRYHFEIEPTPLGFLLRDLGSTNGTFVDGYRVRE